MNVKRDSRFYFWELVCPNKFHDLSVFFLQVFENNINYCVYQAGNEVVISGGNAAFNYDITIIVNIVFEYFVSVVQFVDVFHNSSAVCFFNYCSSYTNLYHYIDAVVNNNHGGQVLTVNFHKGTVQNRMYRAQHGAYHMVGGT